MEHKKAMKLLLAFWQGMLTFLFFLLLNAITLGSPVEKLFPDDQHKAFLVVIAHAVYTVMQTLLLYAILRTLTFPGLYGESEGEAARKGVRHYAKHMLRLPLFWIETAPLLVLGALLTPAVFFPSLGTFFTLLGAPLTPPLRLLLSLSAGLIILAATLLARRAALRRPRNQKGSPLTRVLGGLAVITIFVIICFRVILLLVTHALGAVINLNYRLLPFLFILLLIPALFIGLRLFRAVCIRRKFYQSLARACKESGSEITGVYRPYRSLVSLGEQHTFTLWHKGKRYDCQMLASLGRQNPLYISETGDVEIRHIFGLPKSPIHTVTKDRPVLFEYTTKQHFAFEGEGGKKILIILPIPTEIYAGNTARHTPADVGERIGEYTLYNGTGFLNAIERDCL